MWRWNALIVALLLAHETAATSWGQPAPSQIGTLPPLSRWVRFEVVLGRIVAIPLVTAQIRLPENQDADDPNRETLAICNEGGDPSLVYELWDTKQSVRVEIVGPSRLSVSRGPRGEGGPQAVSFSQSRSGEVTLMVGQPPAERTLRAAYLWRLLLAEPDICREHFIPLANLLRPEWKLEETAERIEASLCQCAGARAVPRETIVSWVRQLGSSDFKQRQAADRELRTLGVSILPHLEDLDRSQLTSEQRARVRRMEKDLRCLTPDTPERVAVWMGGDENMWREWAIHRQKPHQEAAAKWLARAHGRESGADPRSERATAARSSEPAKISR